MSCECLLFLGYSIYVLVLIQLLKLIQYGFAKMINFITYVEKLYTVLAKSIAVLRNLRPDKLSTVLSHITNTVLSHITNTVLSHITNTVLSHITNTKSPINENRWICNSVDGDEVANNEPPHLDLYCLHSSLWILNMIQYGQNIFLKSADVSFAFSFLGTLRVKI